MKSRRKAAFRGIWGSGAGYGNMDGSDKVELIYGLVYV